MPAAPDRIADKAGAEALVADIVATMRALEAILEAESAHVRAGRLRAGLAESERKATLSARYLQGLEHAKANAIALARFAPAGLEALRKAHRGFLGVVETNQAVLGTAKTVSEGLIKTLAAELGKASTPTIYGRPATSPSPYGRGVRTAPLLVSRSL